MTTPPRRLTFSVGASLLTASLALSVAGCDDKPAVNPKPEAGPDEAEKKPAPNLEDPFKNTPEPEPTLSVNPVPEPPPEPVTNVGREPEPKPVPEHRTNVGREYPEPAPAPTPAQ